MEMNHIDTINITDIEGEDFVVFNMYALNGKQYMTIDQFNNYISKSNYRLIKNGSKNKKQ